MSVLKSFAGGLLMTMVLVILVPIICDGFIMPYVSGFIGDQSFLMMTSDMLVNLLMYLIFFGFMALLGGTMIYKTCGVVGVLGLIAGYALLGDVNDALVPVLMLLLSMVIMKTIEIKRRKKEKLKNGC